MITHKNKKLRNSIWHKKYYHMFPDSIQHLHNLRAAGKKEVQLRTRKTIQNYKTNQHSVIKTDYHTNITN